MSSTQLRLEKGPPQTLGCPLSAVICSPTLSLMNSSCAGSSKLLHLSFSFLTSPPCTLCGNILESCHACVLSRFSHVQLCATLGTVAYQAHSDNLVFTCVVFFPSGIIVIVAWAHFLERYFSCIFACFP